MIFTIYSVLRLDFNSKTKYSMTMTQAKNTAALTLLAIPLAGIIAHALYKLALEVWCIAYGLIY